MLGHILSFQRWKQWCCIWLSLEKRKEKDVKEMWWVYSILHFVCQGVNSNVPGTAVQSCWAQKPGTDCRGGAWYGIFFTSGCTDLRTSGSRGLQGAFEILPVPSISRTISWLLAERRGSYCMGLVDSQNQGWKRPLLSLSPTVTQHCQVTTVSLGTTSNDFPSSAA